MRRFTIAVETDVSYPKTIVTDGAHQIAEELAVDGDGTVRVDVTETGEAGEDPVAAWHVEPETEEESGS